jgi:hypothetical protein
MGEYGLRSDIVAQPFKGLIAYMVSLFYPFYIFLLPLAFLFILIFYGILKFLFEGFYRYLTEVFFEKLVTYRISL